MPGWAGETQYKDEDEMQIATIAGNVGRDAELKQTSGGHDVLNFAVAVNERRDGKDVVTWYDCAVWGKRGVALERYITKGTKIAVVGRLGLREFKRRDGSYGATMTIQASEITLQGGGGDSSGGARRDNSPPPMDAPDDGGTFSDDEIPF